MRTTLALLSVAFVLLVVSLPGTCDLGARPEDRIYAGVPEALRDWRSKRLGMLTEAATLFLLEELSLNWKFTEGLRINSWDDVRLYSSEDGHYLVLVGAKAGEWGQYGGGHYCLIDSAGHKYWERQGRVGAPPKISNRGTVALRYQDGDGWELRVDFIDSSGDSLGSIYWADRMQRPLQRRFVEEKALFTSNGGLFVITVNLSEGLDVVGRININNTFLFGLRTDGSVAWKQYLGAFRPGAMKLERDSRAIRVEGVWRERLTVDEPFDEGFLLLDLEGNLLEKTITRTVNVSGVSE